MNPRAPRATACLLLLGLAAGAAAQPADAPPVRVESEAPAEAWVGEAVVLRLRVLYDAAWLREHAVPLYRQETDLPFQVLAPWLDAWAEAAPLPAPPAPPGATRRTLVLGEAVEAATAGAPVTRDGRAYETLEVVRRYAATAPGDRTAGGPVVRYAHAAAFDVDALGGRVPRDRRLGSAEAPARTVRVRPLPEEGRPPEFAGAVGRFAVGAAADRTSLAAGEVLRLTVRVEGTGNLPLVPLPRLEGLDGFHVYGALEADAEGPDVRRIAYDLAPLHASVREVPAIPFAYFDPAPPAGYRVARTAPIPLEVRPGRGAPSPVPPPRPSAGGAWLWRGGILAAAFLLLVAAVRARRRRRHAPVADPEEDRRAAAARRARSAPPGPEAADALAEYLACELGCPPAAVIAPDLGSRLEAAGIAPDLAHRAAALLEALVSERYGGAARAGSVAALVDDLRAAFRR